MMEKQEFKVIIHRENGSFWAEVPDLPGLFASGDDLVELSEALREALSMYLDLDVHSVVIGDEADVEERTLALA